MRRPQRWFELPIMTLKTERPRFTRGATLAKTLTLKRSERHNRKNSIAFASDRWQLKVILPFNSGLLVVLVLVGPRTRCCGSFAAGAQYKHKPRHAAKIYDTSFHPEYRIPIES